MKLELKAIAIGTYQESLDSFWPEDEECFGEWVTISVGIQGDDGADNFNLFICSPDWLKQKNKSFDNDVWGLHKLILLKYNSESIQSCIKKKLDELSVRFSDNSEKDLMLKVARYAHWEFEDYVPYETT
jgi:hypothetical protein